ncbi:MAG: membrane protease YdiL (CAAX protease family) [Hyphomicrobiaceae bacterium]|jgi:membrane protease YdiL (CAAX protease family)
MAANPTIGKWPEKSPPASTRRPTEEPRPAQHETNRGPFGPYTTVLASLFIGVVYFGAQAGALLGFASAVSRRAPPSTLSEALAVVLSDGSMWAAALLLSATTGIFVIATLVYLRRDGPSLREYLALRRVSFGIYIQWIAAFVILTTSINGMLHFLGHQVVSDVMLETYTNASKPALLWVAFIVAAPLFEEVFFRGFLYASLVRTRLGVTGTIIVTSLVWARMHTQQEPWGLIVIIVLGLALGMARAQSASLLPPLLLHILNNTLAMLQTVARS